MSTRRKQNSNLLQVSILIVTGLFILAFVIYGLDALALSLGLVPDAFVIAALSGLAALVVYSALLAGWVVLNRRTLQVNGLRALELADVDHMTGTRFEEYVAALLTGQGYHVTHTGQSGDLGVDLVASRPPLKVAVQCKRLGDPVSRRAVSDAVAGMSYYHCNAAMVVSNSHFTPGARDLARSTGCQLVDREALGKWILAFQNK
ncbi:MAG: restriction endonuclease [Anaerolineae bacterium]